MAERAQLKGLCATSITSIYAYLLDDYKLIGMKILDEVERPGPLQSRQYEGGRSADKSYIRDSLTQNLLGALPIYLKGNCSELLLLYYSIISCSIS